MSSAPTGRPHQGRPRGPRGPGPWLVLVGILVVPALALFGLRSWADSNIDDGAAAPPLDADAAIVEPSPALTTAVLGFRRLPTPVSRDVNLEEFREVVANFLGQVNDRSCAAVSVDGVLVGEHNGELAVIPASNQKLPVAAVALEQLGEDFRYTTSVTAATEPIDGVVSDLYLVGGGDPLLSSNWYPESNLERYAVTTPTSLDSLADAVAASGIREVTGSVIGDGSRYDDEFFAPGWGDGVAGLEAGPYDALMANDSRVLGDEYKSEDPSEAAAREFTRLLEDRGIDVSGDAGTGTSPADAVGITSIESAPMSDVVAEMLANSDNNTAELVVKEIGYDGATPGTREAGLQAIREQLEGWEIDVDPLVLVDGSGLSMDNRLTCDSLLTVLQVTGFDSPLGRGLPVAGETGTLSDVFVDHSVAGRLVGKTGTLNNPPFNVDPPAVKALAGYLPVDGGGAVEYVLVLNGPTISDQSEYRPVWNALGDALATYPAGPTPAELGPR